MSGHVYKRCTCPVERDEAGKRLNCARPHGSWTMVADVPVDGEARRRQHSKCGFKTKKDAEAALRAFLAAADTGQVVLPTRTTLAEYLAGWLDAVEPSLAATAISNYRVIVRCYLAPHLGHHRLSSLRPDHLITSYRTLLTSGGRRGQPLSATTVRTTHRILSKALNDAVRDGLLQRSPAAHVPLPRVVKPELQVWTREQVAVFLPHAAQDVDGASSCRSSRSSRNGTYRRSGRATYVAPFRRRWISLTTAASGCAESTLRHSLPQGS